MSQWNLDNEAYLWLRDLRDSSTDAWDTVDEEKDPETYAYFSGTVETLEKVLDKFDPENWEGIEDSVLSEGE